MNETAKEKVMQRYPDAWWCGCGCGGIYVGGDLLGAGQTPKEAWAKALELIEEDEGDR